MKTEQQLKDARDRGIAFLDRRLPDWRAIIKVNLEEGSKLDMSLCGYCVFGNLWGDFDEAMKEFGLNDEEADKMGFLLLSADTPEDYEPLTELWYEALEVENES